MTRSPAHGILTATVRQVPADRRPPLMRILLVALLALTALHASHVQARRPPVPAAARLPCPTHGWHASAALGSLPGSAQAAAQPLHLHVPEGFAIERVAGADLLSYPMFLTPAGEGRLYVFEATAPNTMSTEAMLEHPSYHVRLLEDRDGDGVYDASRIFADRIPFPMGGAVVGDDLFVAAAPDLLRLRDTTGDGVADEREVVLTGWTLNVNGAAMGGPFLHPDGWLYITDARRGFSIRRKEGDTVTGKGARIWRVRPDGTGLEWLAGGGFDNSIEIATMPSGDTIGTMTYFLDPRDGLRDALMHWVEGGVYPKPHQVIADDALPLTGPLMPPMTRLARVAHSGLLRFRGAGFGEAYRDNLFSAQFNTGRVMRHVVAADGATYRTEDEPFMTSSSADSHPTDVLQDADDSLLVVETGGWFIKGCPLSRVAKPEVEGGIYRIRRADPPAAANPWPRLRALATAPTDVVVAALSDPSPALRDAAQLQLVARGDAAVQAISAARSRTADEEAGALAVFALSRIGSAAARAAVRDGLDDSRVGVRVAAARAVGLARDVAAVERLERLVRDDAPPVRRQAATALGQIGRPSSAPALVAAAAAGGDRFVQHAVTHALIGLPEAAPALTEALTHPAPEARRVALIALDQRRPSPLTRTQLAPFLAEDAPVLWDTGVWVAAHHPEWADLMTSFLTARLEHAAGTPPSGTTESTARGEALDVDALLVTFCAEPGVQDVIATRLTARTASDADRLRMLDAMQHCAAPEWPARWTPPLSALLASGDAPVQRRVLQLAEARRLAALDADVVRLGRDTALSTALRLEAIGVLASGERPLDAAGFALATEALAADREPPVRQLAAHVLTRAALTPAQLVTLARDHVAGADAFLLPRLVDAFSGSTDAEVGRALVVALRANTAHLDALAEADVRALVEAFPPSVAPDAAALLQVLRDRQAERLTRLRAVEATLGRGNIDSGRRLFFGASLCSTCHAVGGSGSRFGPDLTTIGDIRSRHDIVEAILFPSASFAREYDTYRVRTASAAHTGILKEQVGDSLVIDVAPESSIRLPRSEVTAIEPLSVSMMPPGLDQMLSPTELADLVAFLESLPDPIDRPTRP